MDYVSDVLRGVVPEGEVEAEIENPSAVPRIESCDE